MIAPHTARSFPRWLAITLCAVALVAMLALTWWAYHPGLSGDFLFDDFANLPVLGATGPVDNWATFWRYITSGDADPTGRPLTLLTFLIDAHNWPASPYPFKLTNLILHLINGVLLAWALWWLGRVLASPRAERQLIPPTLRVDPLPAEEGEMPPPSARRGIEGDGSSTQEQTSSHSRSGIPPALRVAPLRNEGDDALLPPSAGRGTEGDGSSTQEQTFSHSRSGIPPALRTDPLRTEGDDALLPPSAGRGTEGDGSSTQEQTFSHSRSGIPPALRTDPLPAEEGDEQKPAPRIAPALAALFGAGAWLLHPLLVSTTLYIVQREAMLPATFVLVAIIGWMAAREALARGHIKRGLTGMLLATWGCTVLAVLSKANGALLPLLLLMVEWIVLAPRRPMPDASTRRWYQRAVTAFLIVPAALVVAYLLYLIPGAIHGAPAVRGWTVGERLLTEPRVVTDYLRLLFIPHAHSSGLFNDAFPISTGWLHPASTIPCMVLILALIAAGFALRKQHPAIALALLFYFAAQLMESGWIPLELYFEHRNYLPAMLLFWPIGIGLTRPGLLRGLRITCAVCLLLALSALTWQRTTLWGDGFRQAQVWAAINPDSARAQTNAALYDLSHDRPRLAAARLRLSLPKHPQDIQAPINLIGAECKLGAVQPQTLTAAENALAHTRVGGEAAFKWFNEALTMATTHACKGLDFAALQATLDAARRNPHWRDERGRQQDLAHLQGELDLAEGHPQQALDSFNHALSISPKPGAALQQAAYLGAHGYPRAGLEHLDFFASLPPAPKPGIGMPRIHAWVLQEQGWWPKETAYLRRTLKTDAAAKQTKGIAR